MSMKPTRREAIGVAVTSATVFAAPAVLTARRTEPTRADEVITGQGAYQYLVNHAWCQLPDKYRWQTTHNVAVDSANNLYVIHEGRRELKDHPSIFVFDPSGKFIRAFGCQFQGGGHGIEIRKEGNEEFMYVTGYQQVKAFSKLTLGGETVWFKKAPMESGVYAAGEDISTEPNWTRQGFLPTNVTFLDDGGFWLADGYGSFCIHHFDKDAKWLSQFGGAGEGKGTFNTSHGLCIDRRTGRKPTIAVTDRAHNTLQFFSMDGEYLETLEGFGWPANLETRDNLMLVPELHARISLLNEKNEVVSQLGGAIERMKATENLRGKPDQWKNGEFVHPHDACFDNEGNIFVAEWVATGRVTKLTRVK